MANEIEHLPPLEIESQLATAMSRALLFCVRREYLDVSMAQASYIQLLSNKAAPTLGGLLRLEQVGVSTGRRQDPPLLALQNLLAACHVPDRYQLVFIVSSDGARNEVYLGIRSEDEAAFPARRFLEYLSHFASANWPGTHFVSCTWEGERLPETIAGPLYKSCYCVALTGIPSLKPGNEPYPQSLDRLLRGMNGRPFVYLVIAKPVHTLVIENTLLRCRDLIGGVHALTEASMNISLSLEASTSESSSFSASVSDSWSHSFTTGTTTGCEYDLSGLAQTAAAAITVFFPRLKPVVPLIGIAARFVPRPSRSWQRSETDSRGQSLSQTVGASITETFGSTVGTSLSRVHINAHAQATEQLLQQYIERFEQARTSGCWDVGVYLLGDTQEAVQQAAMQAKALLSGQTSFLDPLRIHDLHDHRTWNVGVRRSLLNLAVPMLGLVEPAASPSEERIKIVEHPLGPAFQGLTTLLNTEELALLVNLPQREVPGIKVMPTADFSLNPPASSADTVQLGRVLDGGERTSLEYGIRRSALSKHVLVTGLTGSGKSTTCRRLLSELHRFQIPFLIIEPAKDEYVEWALRLNESLPEDSPLRIAIYMPGISLWRGRSLGEPLRLNPLDIVWLPGQKIPNVLPHIDRVKSILNAAFPMQEVLPILLEEALFETYGRLDWLRETPPALDAKRPTLTNLMDTADQLVRKKGYAPDVKANLNAALTSRITSLRWGWKRELFDQSQSTSWTDLFDRPVVVNLSNLGDDADKAFTMSVLLQFLYEYRQAQNDLTPVSQSGEAFLRHVTVVEEAHRIMMRASTGPLDIANPQGKVAEMFSNILSEIRAYGEGLVIVDQIPSRLIPDAIKNTNLKIVHRLVADDDRKAMGNCMTLTEAQTNLINRLRPGQAIVFGDLDDMATWVEVPEG